VKTVRLNINGRPVTAPEGTNLLEAARAAGVPVEHFCYHRYLAVDGNCRTCMAEIAGPKGATVTIACNTKVAEGMDARFDSPAAVRAQRAALEFLLLDHPLDCPVCDKAGECFLQDHYQQHGLYDPDHPQPRFFKGGKALDVGEHIVLDQERCVLCTRCIRFLDSVPRTSELCITGRGHEARLGTFPGRRLDNPYSGNVTDVCPVGALTLKEFRFKQRVWFLKRTESVCPGCSRGCNITVEHHRGRIWRFMPRENPHVNLSWMCDEGRLSFARQQEDRLTAPRASGRDLHGLDEALERLERLLRDVPRDRVAGLASPGTSTECLFALRRLFSDRFDPANLAAFVPEPGQGDDVLRTPQKHPNEQGLRILGIPTDAGSLLGRLAGGAFDAALLLEGGVVAGNLAALMKALGRVKTLVVLSPHVTTAVGFATLALPVAAFYEKDGTFVNARGRLQRFRQAFPPPEGVLPASALLSRLGGGKTADQGPHEVFAEMAREVAALRGKTLGEVPPTGVDLKLEPIAPEPFAGVASPRPNVAPEARA
jgi:NADH-quinone oxidoreductase subunit G